MGSPDLVTVSCHPCDGRHGRESFDIISIKNVCVSSSCCLPWFAVLRIVCHVSCHWRRLPYGNRNDRHLWLVQQLKWNIPSHTGLYKYTPNTQWNAQRYSTYTHLLILGPASWKVAAARPVNQVFRRPTSWCKRRVYSIALPSRLSNTIPGKKTDAQSILQVCWLLCCGWTIHGCEGCTVVYW